MKNHGDCRGQQDSVPRGAETPKDGTCGCFFCLKVFSSAQILTWIDEAAGTALCPYCGNDTVLWGRPGLPITEDFLKTMKDYWVQ